MTNEQDEPNSGQPAPAPQAPGQAQPAASPSPPSFFSDFIDLIYGIFVSPVTTLRRLAQRQRPAIGATLSIYLVVVLVNALAGGSALLQQWRGILDAMEHGFGQSGTPISLDGMPGGIGFVVAMAFAALLWGPIGLFFKAGALNLMSGFMGGRGDGRKLFASFGLTYAPILVSVPVGLLLNNRPELGNLAVALALGLLVWRLILDIIAIREVHGLDTGRAIGVALIPLGIFVALVLIMVLVWFSAFVGVLGPMLQSGLPGAG